MNVYLEKVNSSSRSNFPIFNLFFQCNNSMKELLLLIWYIKCQVKCDIYALCFFFSPLCIVAGISFEN